MHWITARINGKPSEILNQLRDCMEQDVNLYHASDGEKITIDRTNESVSASRELDQLGKPDGRPIYTEIKAAAYGQFSVQAKGQKHVYKLNVDDNGEYRFENANGSYSIRQISRQALEPLMFV